MERGSGSFSSFRALKVHDAPDIAWKTLDAGMENTQIAFTSMATAFARTAWSSIREFILLLAMSFGVVALVKYCIDADDDWLAHLDASSSLVGTIGSLLGNDRHSTLGPTHLQTG